MGDTEKQKLIYWGQLQKNLRINRQDVLQNQGVYQGTENRQKVSKHVLGKEPSHHLRFLSLNIIPQKRRKVYSLEKRNPICCDQIYHRLSNWKNVKGSPSKGKSATADRIQACVSRPQWISSLSSQPSGRSSTLKSEASGTEWGKGGGKKKNGIKKSGVLKESPHPLLRSLSSASIAPTSRLVSKLEDLSLKKLNCKLLREKNHRY